ncbi:inactive ribonuclease-like protein 9 [Phyllostomus hastatus]|uniref:inactive ribonuclease-like protein 9 n=1 Tax=Phyllostomus hastatus TaxID=9423 RepID=UPI001E682B28|nr:inactive ribonuclease-like protein 9 [Phyllostomus hastatus]
MKTLLTMQSLPLLLLLLQPLPLQVLMQRRFPSMPDDVRTEEFEEFVDELYSTGPTKPPTKKIFQNHFIIPTVLPFYNEYHCNWDLKIRHVHDRFSCRKEHFFLLVSYEELQKTCSSKFVACRNGVRRCHKTERIIEGVYCKLTRGIRMPECTYEGFPKKGYALITCRWQDDIGEIIPEHVNDILEIPGKH